MSQDPRETGWLPDLLKAWLFRGATEESTISEHIQWNLQTKGCLPIMQAAGVSLGLTAGVLGLWFILGIYVDAQRNAYAWSWVPAAIGFIVLVPGALLAFHQSKALLDPFGKTSALERKMLQYVDLLFGVNLDQQDGEELPERLLPVRSAGRVRGAATRAQEASPTVHPLDARMIQFIVDAQVRGLGRRHWLGREWMGERVGRGLYDVIMDDLERWEFVDRGGDGVAARWLTDPDKALEILRNEIEARDGEV